MWVPSSPGRLVDREALRRRVRELEQRAAGRAAVDGEEVAAVLDVGDVGEAEADDPVLELGLALGGARVEGVVVDRALAERPGALRQVGLLDELEDPEQTPTSGRVGLHPELAVDRRRFACGRDRRRRSDGADAGGRAGVGGGRRRHRRAARQPGAGRLARRRSARAHDRGSRPAWDRRSVPLAGAGGAGRGVRRDRLDISDFPTRHPYGLGLWQNHIERILAELGRRAGRADPSRPRGDRVRAGRCRRRRRAVRRAVAAGGVPRRVRRGTQPDPQDSRHRVPRVGRDDELPHRRGRDGRGAAVGLRRDARGTMLASVEIRMGGRWGRCGSW